jgi:hypothetical protein
MDMGLLIVAHMMGDYLFQNDWMAQHKTVKDGESLLATRGLLNCLVHCLIYTLCVAVVGLVASPRPFGLIGLVFVFVTHVLMDRYRLATVWMKLFGQHGFKEHMSPWSVIVVDNSIHLFCSFLAMVFYTQISLPWWL